MIYSAPDTVARTSAANAGVIAAYAAERGIAPLVVSVVGDAYSAPMPAGVTAPFPDGKAFVFESLAANGGPVTINIGGTGAKEITHLGAASLVAGDIPAADTLIEIFYDVSIDKYHAQLIRQPSASLPAVSTLNGTIGTSTRFSRGDHSHPADLGIIGINSTGGAYPIVGGMRDFLSGVIEITGALVSDLLITCAMGATVNRITFDNKNTGAFFTKFNGVVIPSGKSEWYWNGAALEMIDASGFYTAQVTPLPGAGVATIFNHYCGGVPESVEVELVCLTAEFGYVAGDVISDIGETSGGVVYEVPWWRSATQVGTVGIAGLTGYWTFNKTTGSGSTLTPANWALRFKISP